MIQVLNMLWFILEKKKELSLEIAYNNMFSSIIHVLNKTKDMTPILLLETTAGQGTELCYKLEDLAYFYKKFKKHRDPKIRNRIGLCVDTCHIFSAGYDLRNEKKVNLYLETFNELIGLSHIKLIHLNDSGVEHGKRVDRHESLGYGKIGLEGLMHFAKKFIKMKVPLILETPANSYLKEIPMLERLENSID
ncbi:MAG: hypothetical protein CMF62_02220 [Magnetococcales bacterium]|nr:hypothetical protein [Magnetococcales bacterium]